MKSPDLRVDFAPRVSRKTDIPHFRIGASMFLDLGVRQAAPFLGLAEDKRNSMLETRIRSSISSSCSVSGTYVVERLNDGGCHWERDDAVPKGTVGVLQS